MLPHTELPLSEMIAKSHAVGGEASGKRRVFQSYEGHVADALRIFKSILEYYGDFLASRCKDCGVSAEHFYRNTFGAIALHDIGKLTQEFQMNIKNGRSSSRHPHPYFAIPIFWTLYKERVIEPLLPQHHANIELCAMLSHHTELHRNLYDSVQTEVSYCESAIKEAINSLSCQHAELGLSRYFDGNFKQICGFLKWKNTKLRLVRVSLIEKMRGFPEKTRLKSLFTLMFSILQLCDDYSSAHFANFIEQNEGRITGTLGPVLIKPEQFVQRLKSLPPEQILAGNIPYEFQAKVLKNQPKFCIISAPCGRGKSEGGLLWAQGICQKLHRNKIIFALPTQITSNAMRERLVKLFGREVVGLFHGKSFVKLKNEKERLKDEAEESVELNEKDICELREETFKGKIFFHPVTVTTVDHLVYSFIHGHSQADFALGQIQNSVVIFDEVHYYQRNTVKHLLRLFSILKELDIPHLLMSGTLPRPLLEEALRINPNFSIISDEEGFAFTPFRIELIPRHLVTKGGGANEEVIDEIIKNYQRGLKQFIILNTIQRAQDFYAALKKRGGNIICMLHHSQFVYKDRIMKEDEIQHRDRDKQNPFILVSSQVIEISLDISCDIMYTELAPIDALGQRGGRLDRGGKVYINGDREFVMKVFEPEKDAPYIYEENEINFMNRTRQNLIRENLISDVYSYQRIKEICDRVYDGIELESRLLNNKFDECALFGSRPSEITWEGAGEEGKGFKFREIVYQKIDVMPNELYLSGGAKDQAENLASVPLWWLKRSQKNNDGNFTEINRRIRGKKEVLDYWVCGLPYSFERGFEYPNDYEAGGVFL